VTTLLTSLSISLHFSLSQNAVGHQLVTICRKNKRSHYDKNLSHCGKHGSNGQTHGGCSSVSDTVDTRQLHSATDAGSCRQLTAAEDDTLRLASSSRQYLSMSSTDGATNDLLFCDTQTTIAVTALNVSTVSVQWSDVHDVFTRLSMTRVICSME